jgi:hypothetical protein
MTCGICKKSHSVATTYIKTAKYGEVSIDCLIELAEKVIEASKILEKNGVK